MVIQYAPAQTVYSTTGMDSWAKSTTGLVGYASDVIDNTTNLFCDAHVSGRFRQGGSGGSGLYQIWAGSLLNDTSYPLNFSGAQGSVTIATLGQRNAALRCIASVSVDTSSSQYIDIAPTSLAYWFGGIMPRKWFLWFLNLADTLNATSGTGGQCWYTGISYDIQ